MSTEPTAPASGGVTRANPLGFMPQRSFGLKLLLVCGLALLMAIPALFVFSVVYDRSSRANEATREVSERYGGAQTVMGPVLEVAYSYDEVINDKVARRDGVIVVYPETASVDGELTTEVVTRGIHEIPVYFAKIDTAASFDPGRVREQIENLPTNAVINWNSARFYTGVSNTRASRAPTVLTIDGETQTVEPSPTSRASISLLETRLGLLLEDREAPIEVTTNMSFSGVESFRIAPFGRNTEVTITSDWDDPSFGGSRQQASYDNPEETEGFTASWSIPYEARGIPGSGLSLDFNDVIRHGSTVDVRLVMNATPYQSVQRALKYALMFIGFVFLAYFLFEILSKQRAHPAQYVLVGLAQSVFYLLLLAIAEQAGFDIAFLVAATMTVLLTSGYAMSVFKSRSYGLRALGVFSAVYTLIYVLMRLEDYALLVGAFASFAAIGFTMWMTRDINWYGGEEAK